ncbi:Cna B-type domain-containing protein, partial [Ligilactobacillus ceti]
MDTTPRKVSLFLVFLVMFNILLNSMSAVWQSVRATDISNNSPATSAQQKIASKPNEPTFVSDGGKYTLSYILKNYNLFLQDDYQGTHVVGPVVVGGSFEKYLGGLTVGNKPNGYPHKVPSFIGGKVANNLTFNIYSDVPLYLGTVNQGNTYYINRAEYRSYFANNQIRYTDHYVDFSQWQKLKNEAIALNHTSNVHLSWDAKNKRVISSDETKCKITAGYNQKQMAKLQAGCSVTVDENVFPHIMFDVLGHSTTDDTIICSMGENIQLPDLLINGQYPKSIEDNKEGLAIVYALPNAKTVTRQGEVTGHIVAPDAKVDIHGGNYNGTIIAKSMHTNAEGHMWFYNGKKLAYATIELHVKKLWDDDSNRDGKRPKSIFVQLYGDQQKVGPVVKLDDTNNWTYTWKEFRKDLKGNVINYRVDEVSVPTDYSKTIQHDAAQHQWTITNHYTNLKNTIKGEKIWRDNNNEDGLRPKSIDVKLIAKVNGVEFPKYNQTQTVKPKDFANNKWSYEFKDLPVYDHGQKIDYSLKEINVNKHYTSQINGFNIINTHQVKKTAVYVKKVWQDENNLEQIRPNQIKVWLLKNGQRTKKFKVLNNQTNWEAEFVNLNMYEDGKLIQYSIEEEPVKDYQASVINTKKGFNLINTHQVEKTEIKGQKTWKDDNNRDGLRPISIKVKLIAKVKGKEISELSKTQEFKPINVRDNIWHYSFGELPTHYQGSKVKYSVKEIDVPQGYQVTEKGLDLINTHQVEKTEIKGQKTWNDNNNQDGLRPESITIRLYDGDGEVKHITVTAKDKWKYSFTNLPV